jgi:hypothetical protein
MTYRPTGAWGSGIAPGAGTRGPTSVTKSSLRGRVLHRAQQQQQGFVAAGRVDEMLTFLPGGRVPGV